MKIAFNARFILPDQLEGIGWYSYELIRRLSVRFPEHEFLLLTDRNISKKPECGKNVSWHTLYPPARHPLLWWIWFEWSVPRFLKNHEVDLFLSPDGYLSLAANIPQLMVFHDLAYLHYPDQISWTVRNYYRYFVPKFMRKASLVFAVSQATKDDIIQQLHVPSEKILLAYNGCKDEFHAISLDKREKVRARVSHGAPYLLFVGAMHPRKNLVNLVKAFTIFKNRQFSDIKLLLVGRKAWMNRELERTISQSPYRNDIIHLNYLEKAELSEITASAEALIMPSYLEGFGVPVLEALYCDVPVMVSDRFSLPEVAGPGAFVFNPDDPTDMANSMSQFYQEKDHSHRIALGRIHREQFSWDHTADIIALAISRILNEKKYLSK
ncbi:MAG: glycosyltransferase family 4 protein [Saprospiraceae bacterium]|nr:glycosyltransferase family 4 protein [Saprospiraceae bacterium]